MKTSLLLLVFIYCLGAANGRKNHRGLKGGRKDKGNDDDKTTNGSNSPSTTIKESSPKKEKKATKQHNDGASQFHDDDKSEVPSQAPTIALSHAPSSGPSPSSGTGAYDADYYETVKFGSFYLAFVSPNGYGDLTDEQVESLVKSTEDYYFQQAKNGNLVKSLSLTMDHYVLDYGVPEEKFNFYIQFESATWVAAESCFPPTDVDFFDFISDYMTPEYLLEYVRVVPNFQQVNEGFFGAIQAPTISPSPSSGSTAYEFVYESRKFGSFYLAFASPNGYGDLTDEQVTSLVKSAEDYYLQKAKYVCAGSPVQSLSLTMDHYALDHGMPDERFNFYIQFESATWVAAESCFPPADDAFFEFISDHLTTTYLLEYVRVVPNFQQVNEGFFGVVG